MGGYVNIKIKEHAVMGGTIPASEVSVAFAVYARSNRIAGAQYQIFPSDKPAYATVIEDTTAGQATWLTTNAKFFEPVPDSE